MIEFENAIEILEKNCIVNEKTTTVSIYNALEYYVAKDILAPMDIPSFDNSAMDGYAVFYDEKRNEYQLITEVKADIQETSNLQKGEAARIFTGAPVPLGADTVIKQEICEINNGVLTFDYSQVKPKMNVRYQGSQNKNGDIILKKGTKITATVASLLASVGMEEVEVFRKPKIGIIVTGNELQKVGAPLKFGQVYNSNEIFLTNFLKELHISKVETFQVKDDYNLLLKTTQEALHQCDHLIFTGGISVGDYDFVKDVMSQLEVKTLFYKVKQKPGKPLFVGIKESQWIFALPGNPGSVISCANIYVKPVLKTITGEHKSFDNNLHLPISEDFTNKQELTLFLKVSIQNGICTILPNQESFNLISFNEADAIVRIPPLGVLEKNKSLVDVYLIK